MTNQTESTKKGWFRIRKDGSRQQLWPIKLKWVSLKHYACCGGYIFFTRHWWQTGAEYVAVGKESAGCLPGIRAVFGWTFHLGPLKIVFGTKQTIENPLKWSFDRQQHLASQGHAPSVDAAASLGRILERAEFASMRAAAPINARGGAA